MTKFIQKIAVSVFMVLVVQGEVIFAQISDANLPKTFILLKNEQVVNGEILGSGETVQVRSEQGIISLSRNDIVLVAPSLQEVYRFKKENTPQSPDGFAKLAEWCVTNHLVQEATGEFDRAMRLADNPQLAEAIRNRKNATLSMFAELDLKVQMAEQENQKYRQWKDKIPPSTFATFQREILPILVKNCSGITCHSGNSLNEFRFVPNPNNNDVDLAKNLQVVLRYIEPQVPEESPLVLIPISPHGRTTKIFTQQNFAPYEKLNIWVYQVALEMGTYFPLDDADLKLADNKRRHTSPSPPDGNLTFSLPGEDSGDNLTSDNMSVQNSMSSMMQGFTQNPGSAGFAPRQRADFNFFGQQSIVVPGAAPDGWQGHAATRQQTVIMTHESTDDFEQNSVLQQLQRAPVDPFDPVLFNRQYHLQRFQMAVGNATK